MRSFDKTDLRDTALYVSDLPAPVQRAAMLTCARNALSAPELAGYLDALGLINNGPKVLPMTPSGRAAASEHGAEVRRARQERARQGSCPACHGDNPDCPMCHTKETP